MSEASVFYFRSSICCPRVRIYRASGSYVLNYCREKSRSRAIRYLKFDRFNKLTDSIKFKFNVGLTTTRKHSFDSRQIPPNTHNCGKTRPILFFLLENKLINLNDLPNTTNKLLLLVCNHSDTNLPHIGITIHSSCNRNIKLLFTKFN